MSVSNYDRFISFYKTPSFWNGKLAGMQQFSLSQFNYDNLSQQAPLQLPVIPANTVLGKRAEYFFQFCVQHSTNYKLLLHNLQIFNGNRTVGELDFIVEELHTKKCIHIELVYKFYIYHPPSYIDTNELLIPPEFSQYIGPNNRDNFIKKYGRLKNHQLPLLRHEKTQEKLVEYGLHDTTISQSVSFLAHIFIPRSLWQHDYKYINKKCIVGYYMGYDAFAKAESPLTYYIPEKFAWKMQPYALSKSFTHAEATGQISKSIERDYAVMLWCCDPAGNWQRLFVVQNDLHVD